MRRRIMTKLLINYEIFKKESLFLQQENHRKSELYL